MIGVGTARAIGSWTLPATLPRPTPRAIRPLLGSLRFLLCILRDLLRPGRTRRAPGPAAARTTAVYVGGNRLLVGTTIAGEAFAFHVEADDRLLTPWFALTGRHEDDVTDFLLRTVRPDSHCLDVGSNFGFFLCLMARACKQGRVIAVEPDAELAAIAQDNLFLNGVHERGSVIRGAVADRVEEITLFAREYRSGNTSIIAVDPAFTTSLNEPPARPFQVQGYTIDALADRLGGRVDMVKIDVEGAEPLVLAGAKRTIARNPGIVFVMEWSPGQIAAAGVAVADFVDAIVAAGLRCACLVAGGEQPLTAAELKELSYQSAIILRRAA